jgi:hypothetical protein
MPDILDQVAKGRFQPSGKLAVLLEVTTQNIGSIQEPVNVRIFERFLCPFCSTS